MKQLQRCTASLTILLLLTLTGTPLLAQDGDDMMDRVSFSVKAMQGAQYFRTDFPGEPPTDQAEPGFQRVRYNLEVSADLHERISLFVDLGHEPNDFGTGGDSFSPAVDYVALDFLLSDEYTVRLGTPVTGPFNFRGYSDGAATQGNPLIGNSPIDFITAQTGVALIGNLEGGFGFDLTVTSPTFYETFTPGTGFSLIGKARYATSTYGVGAAVMKVTSQQRSNTITSWIRGDGENYSIPGFGPNSRLTHAYLNPGIAPLVLHVDGMFKSSLLEGDVWGGISTEQYSFATGANGTSAFVPNPGLSGGAVVVEEDSQMLFAGATLTLNATEEFFIAGRVSYADNASDWADDLDETSLLRIQGGFGIRFLDKALLKLEFVSQDEGINSPGQVGDNWYAVSTELSVTL
jgi:hypothetical protein